MAEHEYGSMDCEEQKATYNMVMKWGGQYGTGFCMGLGLFFTMLLIETGFFPALIGGIVCMIAVVWIAKTFFTH